MLRHRVNNPLQAILSEAELLAASEAGQTPEVGAAAAAIEQGARRIAGVLAEFEKLADAELIDEEPRGRPSGGRNPILTRALAAELSVVARQVGQAMQPARADLLRPRLRRAARLAHLWLASNGRARSFDVASGQATAAMPAASIASPKPSLPSAASSAAAVALAHRLERLEAEHRELHERLEKRERFWRFATHELRNAANAFVSWAYVLRRSEIRTAPWFAPLLRAAEAVLRRAEEALELDAAGRDDFPIRLETVNLVEAARDALEAIRPAADHHNLTLAVAAPPAGEPVWGMADPDRLQQVLHNLLRNSADATPPGGSICISARVDAEYAILELEDTGPGIPSEIADVQFQLDPETRATGHGRGFGLGLPLSRYLAEQMGGSLDLLPPQPGSGARFILRLPASAP